MSFLSRLHARLGDFWWYSLMMFVALRCGDVINAVVGLWLVPKYVPQEELGADTCAVRDDLKPMLLVI